MFYYIGIGKEWANFLSPLPGEQLFIALLQKRREREPPLLAQSIWKIFWRRSLKITQLTPLVQFGSRFCVSGLILWTS